MTDKPADPPKPQQPHDGLFQHVFSDVSHAAAYLRSVLPATLARRIDWLSLRPEPVTFTNELLSRRQSDLLFSARIQGRELLLYVLVEHQSGSEPMMAARVYIYVGRIWEHLLKESSSTSKLPFVLPVVLHQDERGFKAATDVSQLLDLESLVSDA